MVRLIQIRRGTERRVAVVEEPRVRLLAAGVGSVYALALEAMAQGKKLADLAREKATDETLDYEPIYAGSRRGNYCRRWIIRMSRRGVWCRGRG